MEIDANEIDLVWEEMMADEDVELVEEVRVSSLIVFFTPMT